MRQAEVFRESWVQSFFDGVSFRLAKVGVIIALAVGFMMSAVQIYIDYRSRCALVNDMIAKQILVATPPAGRALYTLDAELAQEVVSGLVQFEFIIYVALKDEFGRVFAERSAAPEPSKTMWLTRLITEEMMPYDEPIGVRELSTVGNLSFVVDMDEAFSPFYQNAAIVISIGLIRSSILVLFLFIAFYYLLTKPLIKLASQIKEINPGRPGEQRLSLPDSGTEDEFQQLAISANQLLDAVDLALAKRRAVEVVLRKSEEHVRQIIDSLPVLVGARNRDGHYIFANKALAKFLSTVPDAMRGSHLSEFNDRFMTNSKELIRLDTEVIDSRVNAQIWEEKWVDINGKERQMHTHVMPMEFYDETVALIVSSDITELKSAQNLMEHMAYHDSLTDLPNRSYLIERLEEEVTRAEKQGVFGALLFIDLDQFKNINDSLGHPAGDAVLKHVAERLQTSISAKNIVVRLGGDEFVVVLNDLGEDLPHSILEAEAVAESLRLSVSQPYIHNELELRVTCSVGIVMFPDEDAGVHELLRFADTAMYKVKEKGRNSIEFFHKGMAESAKQVLVMEGDLHKALENNRFSLHYQPRVDSFDSTIVGAEALLRWEHPERGMIPPAEFIPILEASGLIVDVGLWVIEESIRQVKAWMEADLWATHMRIGVNISPRQFRSSSFVSDVARLMADMDFPANMLEMEITEGIAIQSLDVTVETMQTLKDLGVVFALDDFGTGYSSISYLKQLPVSVLKIDKSFVRDLIDDKNDRVLVETITAMGNMLELEVVAEGVETPEQLSLIKEYDCRYYQGFVCSKPIVAEQFSELLKKPFVDWA